MPGIPPNPFTREVTALVTAVKPSTIVIKALSFNKLE